MTYADDRKHNGSRLWTLKMLSGVHAGAEVVLSDEQATIGNDDTCDLTLDDAALGGRQIRLDVRASGISLTVLDADTPVYIDGEQVDDPTVIEPYQVISMGTSSLALGPFEQPWPQPSSSIAKGPAKNPLSEQGPEKLTSIAHATGSKNFHTKRSKRNRWAISIGLAAFATSVAAWLLLQSEVEETNRPPENAIERIMDIANRLGATVEVQYSDTKRLTIDIAGTIDSVQNRHRFLEELAQTGLQTTVDITSTEELVRVVSPILDQKINSDRRNLVVVKPAPDSPGTLIVSGYVENEAKFAATRTVLERDAGAHANLQYDIETKADRVAIVQQRLNDIGLADQLHIQTLEHGIGLFGPAPKGKKMRELVDLVREINESFARRPELRLSGDDRFLGESTIELDIRAVLLGDNKHVVMRNGDRFAEGSILKDDYRLKLIEENFIVLEKHPLLEPDADDQEPAYAYYILKFR